MEWEEDEIWEVQLNIYAQIDSGIDSVLPLHWQETFNVNTIGTFPPVCLFLIMFTWHPLMSYCSQQLMAMSRDKSMKLANLYSSVDWLGKYSTSLGLRLGEADAQVSALETWNHALELELARVNGERDAQRATAEQKAREVESQAATLR